MDSLVSIIVPIFNLEKYVFDCLYSLINQTYSNIEIICVDDGSTDNSKKIIKEVQKVDERIVYVYKKNGGVSSARNLGLKVATGEYVMFVDADDYIHRQAVEILLYSLKREDADICCSLVCDTFERKVALKYIDNYKCNAVSIQEVFKCNLQLSSWAKIYKKEFIISVSFVEDLSNCEDFVHFISALMLNPKISIVYEELYYYYQRPNSSSRNELSIKKINALKYISRIADVLAKDKSEFLLAECVKKLFLLLFSFKTIGVSAECEAIVTDYKKEYVKKWLYVLWTNSYIDIKIKVLFTMFFFVHPLYELARLIQDPTMKDFYKNRRLNRKKNRKD